jgi:hypothetical protein
MGKYGLSKGYGYFQNIQGGRATVITDSNGDESTTITFTRNFKNTPVIIATAQTSDDTITLCVTNPSKSGFTLEADGSALTAKTFYVGWIAYDDTRPSKN